MSVRLAWMLALIASVALSPGLAPGLASSSKPFFQRPILVGFHRSGRAKYPESTDHALNEASRLWPEAILEVDVQLTRDGIPMLLHDPTVDRTTNGRGRLTGLTRNQVKSLDAGYRFTRDGHTFPFRNRGVTIPTLEEALRIAPRSRFLVQIIGGRAAADAVISVVERLRAVDRVLFASFEAEPMRRVKEKLPGAATTYDLETGMRLLRALRSDQWDSYVPAADVLSIMKEHIEQFRVTDQEIMRIREKGILVQVHTIDTRSEVDRWLRLGVDSILTAYPDILATAVIEHKTGRLVEATPGTHSHNDFKQAQPLRLALENGMTSIEADIYLVDGELRVGHVPGDLQPGRTLESLYLDPLALRIRLNQGRVFSDQTPLTLLVDIKRDGEAVYRQLSQVLERYSDFLTEYSGGRIFTRAVTIILSGDRPVETLRLKPRRLAFIDGRAADLERDTPNTLVPLVSEAWPLTVKWNGLGEMPASARAFLRDWVRRAQARGKKVRFWAAPDTPAVWREQLDANVDLIGTGRIPDLAGWLRENRPRP